MKISELLNDVRKLDLVLPEFQREYVWKSDQAKQLLVSLMRGYPVGSLLFWKTNQPPELKNLQVAPERLGTIKVILDGQQRLTTLYLLVEGEIPPYYSEHDIETDPRNLYFNLDSGDLQYYQPSRMKDNPLWRSVVDCFRLENKPDDINVFEIAQLFNEQSGMSPFDLAQVYNRNLSRLRAVKAVDIPEQTVPVDASITDAIDIFDRVNSQGTKLSDAELALTHITGKWSHARRTMKEKIQELEKTSFNFELPFMTRALTGIVTRRALFDSIHNVPREELLEGWDQLTRILDYLVTILPQRAFIHSTIDLNTTNVLVPLIVYLSGNNGHFPSQGEMQHALNWLYAAHIWARYSAQTDQKLEHDVSIIVRSSQPWKDLRDQIIDQRGRIEVQATDLVGRGVQQSLYRMTYILAKAHGAVDWFNGAPLGSTHGKAYRIHSHHIFPEGLLYRNGYDSENHVHRQIVNEIANRAFLTADTNRGLSDTPPEEYLSEVENRYPTALARQFIPVDPYLWRMEHYADFLHARREMIATKINEFMDALITEPVPVYETSIAEMTQMGESATLEFKSTLQWDVVQNAINKELRYSSLKTISAFLNSSGGTLVIGVEDNGDVYGLERDLAHVKNQSIDGFEQHLVNLINDTIGVQYSPFIKTRYEEIDGRLVCAIDVKQAPQPVYMKTPKGTEFFVRAATTTRSLNPEETMEYVQMNWS